MESNCRKLVSACVQLGKRYHRPPCRRQSCPAAVWRCVRLCSRAGRPRGSGTTSAKGCAASGADHPPTRLPLPFPPPRVADPRRVQPAAVECLYSEGGHLEGEMSEGRCRAARSPPAARCPGGLPGAGDTRRPLRAAPRARCGRRQRRVGPGCAAPGRPLLSALRLQLRGRGRGKRAGKGGARTPAAAAAHLLPPPARVPPKKSIAVSAPFRHPQRRSRIYFYFLFFDTTPSPVNKPPALSCPQR